MLSKMHATQNWLRDSKYCLLSKTALFWVVSTVHFEQFEFGNFEYLLLGYNSGPDLTRVNIPKKK